MMKQILIILLWSLSTVVHATGPSYTTIKLTPLATHPHGEVLFKISRDINGMGAGTLHTIRYGWLVVSSKGVWVERIALVGNDSEEMSAKISAYEKGKINLTNPDKVLKELMKEYSFTKDTPLINEKYKVLVLKPKQSCYLGRCVEHALLQKTIENYYSKSIETTVKSHFIYKGVVLVHNSFEGDMGIEKGGRFDIKNFMIYPDKDIGYFSMKIDGIVLLDNENIEELDTKTPKKPYYQFDGIKEAKYLGFYGKWVPMYQSENSINDHSDYPSTEQSIYLKELYAMTDLIVVLKVTHFNIYKAPDNESGYNVKFKADVVKIIKGEYKKKSIEFIGDFDNAPDAKSYEQIYILHYSKNPITYSSDEFMQFNPTTKLLKFFDELKKEEI